MALNRKTLREIVASGLGLRLPRWPGLYYTITVVSVADVTVPDLKMDLAEAHAAEDLYFNHEKAYADANQIIVDHWGYPANDIVTLGKAPTGVVATDKCEFYFALAAGEINAAIDEALSSLWFEDSGDVALTADQNEVDLTATLSWLKNSGQLFELMFRETISTKKFRQRTAIEFEAEDMVVAGAQKLKVYLWNMPADVVNKVLRVRGKHYYEALASDTAETVCPQPLIVAAAKIRVVKRLPSRLRDEYADRLRIFQSDLAEARLLFLPLSADKPLTSRTYWQGIELPCDGVWSW